ncbi:unnamed protein product, partial [Effrenium voratum]
MTVDTASLEASIPMAGKDCVKLENLSSGFFDFDELDKAENELPSEPTTNEGHEEDGLDSLSELWPGDMPADQELEDDEDDLPDLVPGDCPVDSSPAWEVCVLRLLVRKLPSLEAPVQGICHEHELLFEEPGCAEADWLCLENRSGFVLKDQLVFFAYIVAYIQKCRPGDKGLIAEKKAASPSVAIIYYSTYGHVKTLAEQIKKGLESTGVNVDLFQIPETLSPDVLKAMSAPDKPKDVMQLDLDFIKKLPEYDGLMFGMPTRFGMMPAQMKACFDATGQLWQSGALAGKLAATFVSTGTQQGGQETTHFTAITSLVHHGMAYVPLGYQAGGDGQFDVSEIHGGSPWGASTLAGGDGSRQPSELELKIAGKHGEVFGGAVKRSV